MNKLLATSPARSVRLWQEVTVEMLTELDRLVQLLESPIFTFLRMEVSS